MQIVVCLVFVETDVAVIIRVHAARVETSSVLLHFFLAGIIPGMIRFLFSAESDELHRSVVGEISPLCIKRIKVYRSPVDVSVRTDVGQAGIEGPMVVQQSGTEFYRFFVRIEGSVRSIQFGIRLHRNPLRLHIHAGTESTGTVGRSSRTALHLYILHR